jgi:alkanesulfonate monooxygenase SsuD/methylene tetrahydromethanopterin reductase-like flavin-dependent oxidoreductase (luciferase family)
MSSLVGVFTMFQKYDEQISDADVFDYELRLAELYDQLGFGRMWIVEHHFDRYAMSPDNFVELSYIAAKTKNIKLGVGAAILPWNDPLRVAEKAILLDNITKGRVLLALGRGLARMEYEGLRIPMSEARERFDEAAAMIQRALETGVMENDGPFYKQPRVELRPKPFKSFEDRLFTVAAASPESLTAAARVGGPMMGFVQSDVASIKPSLEAYKAQFREMNGREAPWPVLTDVTYCHEDPQIAAERAHKYIGQLFELVVSHYDFAGKHFANTKGYQAYAAGAQAIRDAGQDAATQAYVASQLWGTPDQLIQRFRERVEVIGPYQPNFQFAMGGLPPELVEESVTVFGRKVLPALNEILEEAASKQRSGAAAVAHATV